MKVIGLLSTPPLTWAASPMRGYEGWLRGVCKRLGGFEPDIVALANSPESLIGMVAAGRGVCVGPEIIIRERESTWRSVGDVCPLTEPGSHFELFAIRKDSLEWNRCSDA